MLLITKVYIFLFFLKIFNSVTTFQLIIISTYENVQCTVHVYFLSQDPNILFFSEVIWPPFILLTPVSKYYFAVTATCWCWVIDWQVTLQSYTFNDRQNDIWTELSQEGRRQWVVYYTSPKFLIMFSYSFTNNFGNF